MAQDVGDAVLHFLGDSTDLDTKFDKIGPDAEKAFGKAADAVEEGTGRMKTSMGEARGEVALLGEAFGVHLPRHVRSFIAELPGVSSAMSAAFSATAVLFVAKAIVELTEKVTEAVAEFVYAKSVWEETTKSVVDLDNELVGLEKEYASLKKEADDYGKSALQLANENRGQVKESIKELNAQLREQEDRFKALIKSEEENTKTRLNAAVAYDAWKSGNLSALQALKAWTLGIETSTLKHKEHDEIENKILVTHQKLENAQQKLRVATNSVSHAQDELNAKGAALQKQMERTAAELDRLNTVFNRTKVAASEVEIITPANVRNLLTGIDAVHKYSIVLRQDLWQALQDAKKAEDDFAKSGISDGVALKQLQKNVEDARKALDSYGKSVDKFKLKSHGMWKEMREDAKEGATTLDEVKQLGVTAFDEMSRGLEGAIATSILATGSFTQALEKATASALASLASQALVKALFYTAEGFAALAGFEETSAGQYFAAAGEMAAVGAAAGLAARGLSGDGGQGGGSHAQSHDSISNTSQSNRSGGSTLSVQAFAEGGLVTGPTLAMIGEAKKKEVVLPLNDPKTAKALRDGGVGGDTHVHFNIQGLISDDKLDKVVQKISKRVSQGKVQLTSSNSLRLTKRSI